MQLLDTDYDNYMIGYQCFDNMEFSFKDGLEPVHIITVGIAARDRNASTELLSEWEKRAVELVPDLKEEDLADI